VPHSHKRELSATVISRSSIRKEVLESYTTTNDIKLPSINPTETRVFTELDPKSSFQTPRSESITTGTLRLRHSKNQSEDIKLPPLTTRFQQPPVGPSPAKGLFRTATISSAINTALSKFNDTNNENNPTAEIKEELLTNSSMKESGATKSVNISDIAQKMYDLEKRVVVKERAMEMEQMEIKKQVEEMKHSLGGLIVAFNGFTQK